MINDVLQFNKLLCDKIEPTWLRRNSSCYSLVSYINHITSLFLGEQYDDVALFIKRANSELERLEIECDYSFEYFEIVKIYIKKIAEYLLQNNLLAETAVSLLPEKLKVS